MLLIWLLVGVVIGYAVDALLFGGKKDASNGRR
jgi:hypothetical protein